MTDNQELSFSQQMELQALTGNKQAILQVISDLRSYRGAFKEILTARYGRGGIDGHTLDKFVSYVMEIENGDSPVYLFSDSTFEREGK